MSLLNWFKKYWQELAVIGLAAGFFVAASVFIYNLQDPELIKWSSPDENANYFFSKYYAETDNLYYYEDLNLTGGDIITTRSMRSDSGVVKPVSFLGLILLYGKLASFFSAGILPYLTPFFAALGIIFYYFLIRKIFGRPPAFVSTIIMAIFPVYFYYTVRSFFHNVLFVDFLIFGLYFLILASEKYQQPHFLAWRLKEIKQINWRPIIYTSLAGLFLGFSMTVRASEALWFLPALGLAWLLNIKKFGLLKILIFLSFASFAYLPQIYWNKILYQGFTNSGYTAMNDSLLTIAEEGKETAKSVVEKNPSSAIESLKKIKASVFVFGFRPDKAKVAFDNYFIKMFYWLFWSAILGLMLFLLRFGKSKNYQWSWFLAWLLSSLILVLYYGSWDFHDNPDPKEITIGNSYTRYWLPVYFGAIPFAVFFFLRLTWAVFAGDEEDGDVKTEFSWKNFWRRFFSFKKLGRDFSTGALRAVILIFLAYLCVNFIFLGSKEGLIYSFLNQEVSLKEYRQVLSLTEENSVIITKYHDKLFFPQRRVIVGLFDDKNINNKYHIILDKAPVYYYNFNLPEADFNYLNTRKLPDSGLSLKAVQRINNVFTLYKLEKK